MKILKWGARIAGRMTSRSTIIPSRADKISVSRMATGSGRPRKLKKVKESTESAAVIRAEKDIHNADIIIFVIDISKRLDQNDLFIAHRLLKSGKPIIIAANKWDLVAIKENHQEIIGKAKRSLNFMYFAPLLLTSAVSGKNIFNLMSKAESIHLKLNTKIKTPYLNQAVQDILKERKFLTENNK